MNERSYKTSCPYWTDAYQKAACACTSFKEIGNVALDVLRSMPQPVCQLCGPISTGGLGSRERNTALFTRAIDELRTRGCNPFDQFPLQNAMNAISDTWHRSNPEALYCMPLLEDVYYPIFSSGLITKAFFLPDWETSFGARWEHATLSRLGIEIQDFPREWYARIAELDLLPNAA